MNPLAAIKLAALMERSSGDPGIMIGLIDGPVLSGHPDLSNSRLRSIAAPHDASCGNAATSSCVHGTFVAGVLSAARGSPAPAICPECTLLIRPIFVEKSSGPDHMPGATPQALATALFDCIDAGARIINLSLGLAHPSIQEERTLNEALDHASARGVIIVAAAGNQGTLGSTAITRHPWVIPVVACDLGGRPIYDTNLGTTMGRHGLSAPGDNITSLGLGGEPFTFGGTSVAVPFVTGTAALLWSLVPTATATQIKFSLLNSAPRRRSVVPPLLNAAAAYQLLHTSHFRRSIS